MLFVRRWGRIGRLIGIWTSFKYYLPNLRWLAWSFWMLKADLQKLFFFFLWEKVLMLLQVLWKVFQLAAGFSWCFKRAHNKHKYKYVVVFLSLVVFKLECHTLHFLFSWFSSMYLSLKTTSIQKLDLFVWFLCGWCLFG